MGFNFQQQSNSNDKSLPRVILFFVVSSYYKELCKILLRFGGFERFDGSF